MDVDRARQYAIVLNSDLMKNVIADFAARTQLRIVPGSIKAAFASSSMGVGMTGAAVPGGAVSVPDTVAAQNNSIGAVAAKSTAAANTGSVAAGLVLQLLVLGVAMA